MPQSYRDAMKFLSRIGALSWIKMNEPYKLDQGPGKICDMANRFASEGIKTKYQFEAMYGPTTTPDTPEHFIGKSALKVKEDPK